MVIEAIVFIIIHLHQLILSLYPAAFREEFGDEVTAVFTEAVTEAADQSPLSLLILCGRELRDFPFSLIREYGRQISQRDQNHMSTIKRRAIYLFIFIILAIGWRLFAGLYFGHLISLGLGGGTFLFVFAYLPFVLLLIITITRILTWPVVWALAPVGRKISNGVWFVAGLLNFAALFLPASLLIARYANRTVEPFSSQASLTLLGVLTLALVVSPILFYLGINLYQKWQRSHLSEGELSGKRLRQTAVILLSLSFLLLVKALYNLYWFMIWDSTVDSLDYLWLGLPFLVLLFSGTILFHVSSGKTRRVLLIYSLLLPIVLIAITAVAQRVDFRQLTEARAERVSEAIENYYGRYGRFPQNLSQLTPRYILSLPEPVIIYGQTWCYEGGDDYFRLGYVSRLHWSDPRLSGHLHKDAGDLSTLSPLCQKEVAAIQAQYPDYSYEYWMANE